VTLQTLTKARPKLASLLLVAVSLAAAGCGSEDGDKRTIATTKTTTSTATGENATAANGTDLAFVTEMITHHQSAIDMAMIATGRAQHAEIKTLASNIIRVQKDEIDQLNGIKQRLTDTGIKPRDMGMSEKEMGMSMEDSSLRTADPFDRAFIDMMSAHHRGAIAMANMELKMGGDNESRMLAQAIITAQKKEIAEMTNWRQDWYGSSSPENTDTGHSMHTG